MYQENLEAIAASAVAKAALVKNRLGASLMHSALAGAYVGLAIVLIFALGTPLAAAKSPFTSVIMAAFFGLALALVLIAGADLFTGNVLVMTVGVLERKTTWKDLLRVWGWSWIGNALGAILLTWVVFQAGTFHDPTWVLSVAAKKMTAPWTELFWRAFLCNWLVTLSVWCYFKLKSEVAKLIMIWWCLVAFIGAGFEHSVANMTLLTLAMFLPHGHTITWMGWAHNLVPVTLGNIASGVVVVGLSYWYVSRPQKTAEHPATHQEPSPMPRAA